MPNAFEAQPQMTLIVLAACGVLIVAVIVLSVRNRRGARVPEVVGDEGVRRQFAQVSARLEALEKGIAQLADQLPKTVQGVGIVRYDQFPDMGGNMSFSLALLDGRANGVVLSVLHGRESARVYGKSIEGGQSPHALSDEERQALALARGQRR